MRQVAWEKNLPSGRRLFSHDSGLSKLHNPEPPKEKPIPYDVARRTLGKRLEEHFLCDGIAYFIDGQPKGFNDVMIETNRVRKARGWYQVDSCQRWVQ